MTPDLAGLNAVVVQVKAATWLAGAPARLPAQPGARELEVQDAGWVYLDR